MNLHRYISRLNTILRTELGSTPLFSWQYTDSLYHPVIEVESSDSSPGGIREVYETVCQCGTDIRVHEPHCALSVRRKKSAMIRIMEQFPDAWVVCSKIHPDEDAWNRSFGTTASYPTEGYWFPFQVSVGLNMPPIYLKTERGKRPTDEQTSAAVWAVSEWRKQNPDALKYEQERAAKREKVERHDNLTLAIKECSIGATHNLLPGKKVNASYSEPVRLKPIIYNAQGAPV